MEKMLFKPDENIKMNKPISFAEYQSHINRYIFAANYAQGKVVLDIACGTGTGSMYLVSKGAKKVVGVDISEDSLKEAQTWNQTQNLEFILSDAESLPLPSHSFDLVVSFETIEHLKNPEEFLLNSNRLLKNGGIFICSTPNKSVTSPIFRRPSNPYHVKEYYPKEFCDLVGRYFGDVITYGQRTLNLKDRLKMPMISTTAHILNIMPGGSRIKDILSRIGRSFLAESFLPLFDREFDKNQDNNYQILPYQNTLLKTPEYIIVVAKVKPE